MTIRPLAREDCEAIRESLVDCQAFSPEEIKMALEMIEAGLAGGLAGDYPLFLTECDGRACGYVCIGRTPLTRSTWHLYWICVHPRAQGRGLGQALQRHVEEFIRSRGGERIVVETSGRPDYQRARRFYQRAGYRALGRIPDYYKLNDDCVFYCKVL